MLLIKISACGIVLVREQIHHHRKSHDCLGFINGQMHESITDERGGSETIQVPMDQWYLEYYWGWTDNSGYYSESYQDDLYGIYNDMDILMKE